jgi:hypothetical protein
VYGRIASRFVITFLVGVGSNRRIKAGQEKVG